MLTFYSPRDGAWKKRQRNWIFSLAHMNRFTRTSHTEHNIGSQSQFVKAAVENCIFLGKSKSENSGFAFFRRIQEECDFFVRSEPVETLVGGNESWSYFWGPNPEITKLIWMIPPRRGWKSARISFIGCDSGHIAGVAPEVLGNQC